MQEVMKAIKMKTYGGPEVLHLVNAPVPAIKENEVLVEVHAASATAADGFMRSGKPYFARIFTGWPRPKNPIPGTGFAGKVVKTGAAVKHFRIGAKVFGETTLGCSTNAEFVAVPADGVILHLPEGLNYAEACAYGDGHVTSYNFLKEIGNVKPGMKVLINGASGALGTAAVQIAKNLGAEVTGVCSTRNVKLVESLGADAVIDYTKTDFTASTKSYDLVFDTIGKSAFGKCKPILSDGGIYLSPVLNFAVMMGMLLTRNAKKKAAFAATGLKKDHELRVMMEKLIEMQQAGKLQTVIDRQFPLEKTKEAHTYVAAGRKRGNVIISVKQD